MVVAVLFLVAGCGGSDVTSTHDAETAVHPADWLPAGHVAPAREDLNSCGTCHGFTSTTGGISRVSCTSCHLGGPTDVHPATWEGQPWYQAGAATEGHGIYVTGHGTSSCRNYWCHGIYLQGVVGSGPSCNKCHTFT